MHNTHGEACTRTHIYTSDTSQCLLRQNTHALPAVIQVKAISQKISIRSAEAPFPEEISTDDEKQTLGQLGVQVSRRQEEQQITMQQQEVRAGQGDVCVYFGLGRGGLRNQRT